MKVGFDARMIGHPGIGRYIKNILQAMLAQRSGAEFVLYGDRQKLGEFSECEIRDYKTPSYNEWIEFFHSPFEDEGLDMVHIPHFNVPFQKRAKLIVTIHDLIYIKFPEYLVFAKRLAGRLVIKSAIDKADAIIAVSESTKKDIVREFPRHAGKIRVIYEAVDTIFRKIDDKSYLERVRRENGLSNDIILFVGSIRRHKNIERLIEAYGLLKENGISHKLVIVGRCDAEENDILSKIRSTDAIYLGEVPNETLLAIYNIASLVVMPSLYEGFGLPALEAMACGVPVVASSAPALKEVIGDAGILFDPYDTKDIAGAIIRVLDDNSLRQALITKGYRRAADFSWQKAAGETLQVYKSL